MTPYLLPTDAVVDRLLIAARRIADGEEARQVCDELKVKFADAAELAMVLTVRSVGRGERPRKGARSVPSRRS